jgi:hypothetical protein
MLSTSSQDSFHGVHSNRPLKIERGGRNHHATTVALRAYVYAHPKLTALGNDPLVNQLMRAAGFGATEFVVEHVAVRGRPVTVIVLPRHLWRDPDCRRALLEVKAAAAAMRSRCVLVPHSSIVGNKRARAATTIQQGRRARYSEQQLDAVLTHVRMARIATIADCAAILPTHVDPFSAILAMIARGYLDVDRDQPITTASWITTIL